MNLLERFLKYVSIPTFSDSHSGLHPSTKEQRNLAHVLVHELIDMGIDVYYDKQHCYIYGCLRGNVDAPSIGFISHMDTSEAAKGIINPKIIKNYAGEDIVLKENTFSLVRDYPDLKSHIGKTLITTDGNSLLGADDKAGIVEIMTMLEYFVNNQVDHGDIYICFTPDEEIGEGTLFFDFDHFKADYAYTVDGSYLGEINYENFNAATVTITIDGKTCHLGEAKDKLVNALSIGYMIHSLLPKEFPENTEKYQGYYHLYSINGDMSKVVYTYFIRDFNDTNFLYRKNYFLKIRDSLNEKYGDIIKVEIKDRYLNMYNEIKNNMHLIEIAKKAMANLGITPIVLPVRGGTDGAELTRKGLPCANIGTGGHNFHSIYEYVALEDMGKTSEILIGIVREYAKVENQKLIRNKE